MTPGIQDTSITKETHARAATSFGAYRRASNSFNRDIKSKLSMRPSSLFRSGIEGTTPRSKLKSLLSQRYKYLINVKLILFFI